MHEYSIKELVIKDFISKKNRAPTQQEKKTLYNEYILSKPNSLETGILSGHKQTFPLSGNDSSSFIYKNLKNNLDLDMKSILNEVKVQRNVVEHNFRNYFQKMDESLKEIKRLERNVNKNLLLSSKQDIFTYGVIENFDTYDKVDFDKSNINFFNGKVTLSFSSLTKPTKDILNLSYNLNSLNGNLIKNREINTIKNTLYEDGTFFKVIGYSSIENDAVDFIVDIDFSDRNEKYIDTIKIVTGALERNSKISYRCFYSENKSQYTEIFESNLRIEENEIFIEVNKNNVKAIKIIFTKTHNDYKDGSLYAYAFALDFIGLIEKTFKINEESILYLGPYEIFDEDQNPINFSMATLKGGTCCIYDKKSTISFFLSKDNENWNFISFDGNGKEVIQFDSLESSTNDDMFSIIDVNSNNIYVADDIEFTNINLDENEHLLNFYINNENKDRLIKNSLDIRRNILNKDQNINLYNSDAGWFYENSFYHTNIEITQPEGRYINFGSRSCFLNEKQVNGKVFLQYGIHTFKTSSENYYKIKDLENEVSVKNAKQLKQIDKLYPYNHKYLIEGFNYNSSFIGRKVYTGVDEVFSFNLNSVSNQRFLLENSLKVFSILENEIGIFFKIYSSEESSEIQYEDFKISCKKRNNNDSGNLLYIKAVLTSSDIKVSPKIDQIQVRVI